ncbi:MAG: sulfotransferase family 2 domain-containing protein [Sumerlaeia bacterium]
MALMLKCGAVFLHVPKTGGSWVTEVLQGCDLVAYEVGAKHGYLDQVLEYPKIFSQQNFKRCLKRGPFWHQEVMQAFKFGIVRHPLKWYESWFKYLGGRWEIHTQNRNNCHKWSMNLLIEESADDDFNAFVRKLNERCPGFATRCFDRYFGPEVNFVGRCENLVDDLISALDLCNASYDEDRIRNWPRVNESPCLAGKPKWDPELKVLVERLEAPGFIKYGYELERFLPPLPGASPAAAGANGSTAAQSLATTN